MKIGMVVSDSKREVRVSSLTEHWEPVAFLGMESWAGSGSLCVEWSPAWARLGTSLQHCLSTDDGLSRETGRELWGEKVQGLSPNATHTLPFYLSTCASSLSLASMPEVQGRGGA